MVLIPGYHYLSINPMLIVLTPTEAT